MNIKIEHNVLNDLLPSWLKESLLYKMLSAALSNVPFHKDTPSVTRYIAQGFPFHLAVHKVSPV